MRYYLEFVCPIDYLIHFLKKFKLQSSSFAIDFEISIMLGKNNIKCGEVPIQYYPRTYAQGKKINYLDGLKSLFVIFSHLIKK